MRNRCSNILHRSFKHYGGRGISVCKRWDSFELFAQDMGEPGPNQWLDRIDVNGDYEPGNCRWCDDMTNGQNSTKIRMLTIHGRTQCAAAWERETGINSGTILSRHKRGLPDADIINPNLPRKNTKGISKGPMLEKKARIKALAAKLFAELNS